MFRLIRFTFRAFITLKLMALAFSAGMGAAYILQLRAQYRTWGLLPDDAQAFPGDDLVESADVVETRYAGIDAAPAEVWPWLAQLGHGRGGWYSYAALDRPWSPTGGPPGGSADTILDEFGDLAEGDLVPTHPGGGFVARVVEPGRTLVLFLDESMMREHLEGLVADSVEDPDSAKMAPDMPPYAVSWAFVLEDAPGGRTRLIERMRFSVDVSEGQRKAMPVLAMGVFALMRDQMLGIKRRAEENAGAVLADGAD